ncbi:hypothetical protein, partial [Alloprevotella tannerae]|uniref:hypothetical protein n=1 Tax=Alloprevotella tannerae TaxID=76122 RepID=UPI0036118218
MSAIQPSKLGKAHNTTNSFSLFFAPRRRPKRDDSASASADERTQSIGEESRLRRRGDHAGNRAARHRPHHRRAAVR